jgi:hypothetical protein
MEAIRPKPSRNNPEIFKIKLVATLSWTGESSRSRLQGERQHKHWKNRSCGGKVQLG